MTSSTSVGDQSRPNSMALWAKQLRSLAKLPPPLGLHPGHITQMMADRPSLSEETLPSSPYHPLTLTLRPTSPDGKSAFTHEQPVLPPSSLPHPKTSLAWKAA